MVEAMPALTNRPECLVRATGRSKTVRPHPVWCATLPAGGRPVALRGGSDHQRVLKLIAPDADPSSAAVGSTPLRSRATPPLAQSLPCPCQGPAGATEGLHRGAQAVFFLI